MGILIRLLLRNRFGMFILGAILVVIGLVVGASSSQVSYTQSSDSATYLIAKGQQSGNIYIHVSGSDEYYVAFNSDFQVPQNELDTPGSLSFIARSDTSQLDPPLSTSTGTTVKEAHKIEKLVLKDKSGNVLGTFTTDEYNANPNGVYVNSWPGGLICIGLGVIFVILGFVVYRKKPQVAPAAPMGGFQQPGYPPANPYAQPYPGQQPAGQPGANPYAQPYPGQQPAGQPGANPYAQPYPGQPPVAQPGANPYQNYPQQ